MYVKYVFTYLSGAPVSCRVRAGIGSTVGAGDNLVRSSSTTGRSSAFPLLFTLRQGLRRRNLYSQWQKKQVINNDPPFRLALFFFYVWSLQSRLPFPSKYSIYICTWRIFWTFYILSVYLCNASLKIFLHISGYMLQAIVKYEKQKMLQYWYTRYIIKVINCFLNICSDESKRSSGARFLISIIT